MTAIYDSICLMSTVMTLQCLELLMLLFSVAKFESLSNPFFGDRFDFFFYVAFWFLYLIFIAYSTKERIFKYFMRIYEVYEYLYKFMSTYDCILIF